LALLSSHLDGNVAGLEAVLFEHDLDHLLAVGERVHRGLGEEDLAFPGIDLELLEEGIVPHVFSILPVAHDAVIEWVGNL
jgi:hypothetical protein